MGEAKLTGGCLCGAVRYESTGNPGWAGHCHCSLCRRSSGAAYMSWVVVPSEGFKITQGKLVLYASSDRAKRGHCGVCGTPLVFLSNRRPENTGITIASLDHPGAVHPIEHIFWDDRVPSLSETEDLPKRAQR